MKVIRISEPGGPEKLRLENLTLPAPGVGEVLIHHSAIGVNFIDIYHRRGLYPLPLPSGLGVEAVGRIAGLGAGVEGFKVGESVAYVMEPIGAYAEQALVSAQHVFHVPEDLDHKILAASLLKGLTAAYLLYKTIAVGPKMKLLIHAAAGGVGQMMCQWASQLGATVIGSVGNLEKARIARQCGCAEVILYRQENLVDRVLQCTGGFGVDVVYDSVGADTFLDSLKSCRSRGLVVSFGNASGPVPPLSPLLLTQHGSLFLTRPTLAHYIKNLAEKAELLELLFCKLRAGELKIEHQCFSLAESAQAHRALESGETTGSIVLIP